MCICRAGRHGFVILNAVFRVGEGFKYVLDLVMATGIQTTTIGARDRQWARNHATHIRVQIHVCRPCQLQDTCIMRFLKYSFNVESILFVGAHCLGFRWYPLPKNSHPRELIYTITCWPPRLKLIPHYIFLILIGPELLFTVCSGKMSINILWTTKTFMHSFSIVITNYLH